MSVFITKRRIFDEFTQAGGGGIDYFAGLVGDRLSCVIEFYVKWGAENKRLIFDGATKTITMLNDLDTSKFDVEGEFKVGDIFTVVDTASNDGDLTIASISDDGRAITTVEALTDETAEDCSLHGVTPVTALDFYYNLIKNDGVEDYLSLVDKGTSLRYTVDGIDASNVTPVKFTIGTNSYGWVTEPVVAGESSSTIQGVAIADYKQKFKIIQEFYVTPFFIRDQINNFLSTPKTATDLYANGAALKYIFKLDAKFDFTDPLIPHSGGISDENGIGGWFDQNIVRSRPDYTLVSIAYQDDVTSETVERIDIARVTNVTVVLNSAAGQFKNSGGASDTKFVVNAMTCPLDVESYINTVKTLRQNFIHDRILLACGDSETGGDQEGTDYQMLKNIVCTFNSTSQVTITFQIDIAAAAQAILIAKASSNRYYLLWISTQSIDITTTKQSDRVPVLVDFQNADYDQDDDTLFQIVDDVKIYNYPDSFVNPRSEMKGFTRDGFFIRAPFKLKYVDGALLTKFGAMVVAENSDGERIILQQDEFDTSAFKGDVDGIQPISVEKKGNAYWIAIGGPQAVAKIIRYEANDAGDFANYEFQHNVRFRWEETVLLDPPSRFFPEGTMKWIDYQANGFELKYIIYASMELGDHVTDYEQVVTVEIVDDAQNYGFTIESIKTSSVDETEDFDGGISAEENTLVTAVFKRQAPLAFPPGFDGYTATLGIDRADGGLFIRREINSDIATEESSRWLDINEELEGVAEVTVNIQAGTVTVKAIVDYSQLDSEKDYLLDARLDYKTIQNTLLADEDGAQLLTPEGEAILYDE